MVRSRTCTNPSPSSGGFDCTRLGKPVQSTQCYLVDCPIDGNYTAWSNWTTCSATCGEGTKTRTRSCTNPSPLHGGRDCTELGSNIEIKPCKEHNCLGKYWNAEVVINQFPCVHSEREATRIWSTSTGEARSLKRPSKAPTFTEMWYFLSSSRRFLQFVKR